MKSGVILQTDKNMNMETKILIPKAFCEDEVISYIAGRYKTTPLAVIAKFMRHEGILFGCTGEKADDTFCLADNGIAICRGLGIAPSMIEITEN